MGSQDLGLSVLIQKRGFKTKWNPVKVGHDMSVGSDLNNSEGITVGDTLFVSCLKLDLENVKAVFCPEAEHRERFFG